LSFAALFPHLAGLRLLAVCLTTGQLVLDVAPRTTGSPCPSCRRRSDRLHSRYVRRVADQPIGDRPVTIQFHVRRFRCGNPRCPRRTFVEQQPTLAGRSARRSVPLQRFLEDVALTQGGRPGQRFAERRRIRVNRTTLVRLIRRLPEPLVTTPTVLGIDDFALARGHRYGTILVNLEDPRILDLLPERTAEAVAAWLMEHGQPQFVCRDRSGDYASGARQAAPEAVQIADRFHLARNSGEVLERILVRHPTALRAAVAAAGPTEEDVDVRAESPPPSKESAAAQAHPDVADPRRARRLARYEAVIAFHQAGWSVAKIADETGLSRPTIRKYVRAGTFPEWPARRILLSAGTTHATYLQRRWAEGCRDAVMLWNELRAQGFPGSVRMVQKAVARWRVGPRLKGRAAWGATAPATVDLPPLRPPSPQQAIWLLLRPTPTLTLEQQRMRRRLLAAAPEVQTAVTVIEEFRQMIRDRNVGVLAPWLARAERSGIPELRAFALNLRRDYAAVAAALTYPWSAGPVEGLVTKTKLIKRAAYGRANFDLLRKRVLLAA
jgi:transposase